MAIPSSYDEWSLAEYMDTILGEVATGLSWSVAANSYDEPVNEAIALYGVDDIAEISGRDNIVKLRTLSRVAIWRQVVRSTTGDFDFSADGGRYSRSQVNKMARQQLGLEEATAIRTPE